MNTLVSKISPKATAENNFRNDLLFGVTFRAVALNSLIKY